MRALIIGVTGQDGSYLAELLLAEGYEVHGTIRRSSLPNTERLEGLDVVLHHADLTDATGLAGVIAASDPDEVYNLGALSDVRISFDTPEFSGDVTGLGCVRLLALLRLMKPEARFYQAGSSEMFGMNPDVPTNEQSAFYPASPYAASKVFAHQMTGIYRDAYGLFAVAGVAFNHESERRGVEFVTRKITLGISDIIHGRSEEIVLGNLDTKRDWSHARDVVRAMHMILQADKPADYVIASGESHSVREFLDLAFGMVDLDWHDHVRTDESLLRPLDPPVLLGDPSKIQRELGWKPQVAFDELVRLMVEADLKA